MIKRNEFWRLFKKVILFSIVALIVLFLYLIFRTDSTFGINKTVGWAWDITNFTFWIGVFQLVVLGFLAIAIITIALIMLKRFFK